jgi:hypothetical protein
MANLAKAYQDRLESLLLPAPATQARRFQGLRHLAYVVSNVGLTN